MSVKVNFRKPIQIYTDGSCRDTDGGFGIVIMLGQRLKKYSSCQYVDTTANRMEFRAVIHALDMCKPWSNIDIYSDCEYVVNIANGRLDSWIAEGTIKEKANLDILRLFYKARKRHLDAGTKLKFSWVRGHAGNPFNEMADKLAFKACISEEKRTVCKKNSWIDINKST